MTPTLPRPARIIDPCSLALLGSIVITGVIVAVPKDMGYAAPSRLAWTAVALTTSLIAALTAIAVFRRWRFSRRERRYAQGTAAIKDTVKFLNHECRLAARGGLALIASAWIGMALGILGTWPQLAVLEPAHSAFAGLAWASLGLLLAQPLLRRAHLINAYYLSRYLRQQCGHVGFVPGRPRTARERRKAPRSDEYDAGGFRWSLDDLTKNILVLGQPGSGKTVTVLNGHLEKLLAARAGGLATACLILDPKGAYRDVIEPLCRRLGRERDLFVLSPDHWTVAPDTPASIAWNPLDSEDDAIDIASRFVTTARLVGGIKSNDTFFTDAARLFIRHTITLVRAAFDPDPPSLLDIYHLCAEPVDDEALDHSEYGRLRLILKRRYPDTLPADVALAVGYWEDEWRCLPEKQRAGVRSTVTQLLDDFTTYPIAEIVAGRSTITIAEVIDQGKILYVHMPLAGRERLSRIMTSLVKLEFQREILRRVRKPRPSLLVADEFQTLFVAGEECGDSDFFERSRESHHGNLVAVQNLSSLFKKTPNAHEVTNFLGLCATKVLLRNSERETNEWASRLFGEQSEIVVSMSETARVWFGFSRSQANYSRSTKLTRVVPAEAFTTLAIPMKDDPARHHADSIVHLGSRQQPQKLDLTWPVRDLSS